MAVLWLTQFAIVSLNILLGILFVLADKDFCGSVFETRVGELILLNKKRKEENTDSYTLFV